MPTGQSGPKLIAFVALLMACFRQSKRRTSLFVTSILNIPCCPSLTVKHQHIAAQALQPAYRELVAVLPVQPQLNGDDRTRSRVERVGFAWERGKVTQP